MGIPPYRSIECCGFHLKKQVKLDNRQKWCILLVDTHLLQVDSHILQGDMDMDKTHEEIFKMMGRVEGYSRKIQKMAQDNAPIKEMEQQIRAIAGIVHSAKVTALRPSLEAGDIDAALEKIRKF